MKYQQQLSKDRSGGMQYSSLTGCDYKKLYKTLPNKLLFVVNNETHDDVFFLLREFDSIHESVNKQPASYDQEKLSERIKKWMDMFLSLERKGRLGYSRVTPYIII